MSLINKAKISIVWSLTEKFSTQIIGFVVTIILARLILPEEYGLLGMIYIFTSIGTVLLEGGLTQSLIRAKDVDNDDYSSVFFMNIIISFLIYILIYLTSPFIAVFYNESQLLNITRIYCLIIPISAFGTVQNTILIKELKFRQLYIINLPSLILSSIVGIILAYKGFGAWSLVWAHILKSLLFTFQLWIYSNWKPKLKVNYQKLKGHFNFGYKIALMEILNSIFANIYQVIIGKNYTADKVGYYVQANTLKQIPVSNIYGGINKVAFPFFSSIQSNKELMVNYYKKILLIMTYVITPILIFLCIMAEPIIRLLFTSTWLPAVPYLQILCFAGTLHPLVTFNQNIMKVSGRSDLFLLTGILNKIFILIVIFLLNQNITYLLWGQVVAYLAAFLTNGYYLHKLINYNLLQQIKDLLPVFILVLLVGGCIYILNKNFTNYITTDILKIVITSFTFFALYVSFSILLHFRQINDLKNLIAKNFNK